MKIGTLTITALLLACSPAPRSHDNEPFEPTLAKMQSDAAFLASRAHPDLQIVQTFRSDDTDGVEASRSLPCGLRELHAAGWRLLPTPAELAQTGTVYSSPEPLGAEAMAFTIGAAESEADARYEFRRVDGKWRLVRVEVYSSLEAGAALPPLPCPAAGRAG